MPVFTSPATAGAAAAMPVQQVGQYYPGHPQAAYPTMVPFHMPGSYAVAGYTPAMMNTSGSGGIEGVGAGGSGDVLNDPVLASHYQAAQYHAMMQQFMQHNLNMQQQQQTASLGNAAAAAAAAATGAGGGRHRGGNVVLQASTPASPYYPNQFLAYQTHQQHSGIVYPGYPGSNHQPFGNGNNNRGGGGGAYPSSSQYPNTTYSTTNNNTNNNDIALPGISEGPEAEIFQAAVRESGNLSSHDKSSSAAAGGGGNQGETANNEFLMWVRKTLVSIDGGLGGSYTNVGGRPASPGSPSSSLVLTLEEMRGNLVALSRDQIGSRVLQTAMEIMNEDDLISLFEELEPNLEILMADQFGNYVIQRLLDSRVNSIIVSIGEALKGRVLPFSLHVYGCRVVQKALDALPQENRVTLAVELQPFTLHCLSDQNANHVIQKCLETVQPSDGVRGMLETIASHALTLARHSFGCRAVQRLLQYCTITEIHDGVIDEVLSSILELTKNQFGNYVVQHLVAQGPENTR
jgi:Pumilio-family RNA binding repeat